MLQDLAKYLFAGKCLEYKAQRLISYSGKMAWIVVAFRNDTTMA
jgi:hypothetical protein